MLRKTGKRKIMYAGKLYYWFIRANETGIFKIHIISENKRINLDYPLFDNEVPVTPAYITHLLDKYFEKQ